MSSSTTIHPPQTRTYIGRASSAAQWQVTVVDAQGARPLPQHPRHSPDGHAWGYTGSGPAQLALDLLWDVLDVEPAPALYHRFKLEVVAQCPQDRDWSLTAEEIVAWLAEVTR